MNYIDKLAEAIAAKIPPESTPDQDTHDLFRLYALLALSKGVDTTPRDVHNAWSVWMCRQDSAHESLVPFEELPRDTQREDAIFVDAIRAVARGLVDAS